MNYKRLSETRAETIIVTESVSMKWGRRTKAHYESFGYKYTELNDEFVCSTDHLTKSSNVRVTVRCPICGDNRSVVYNDLTRIGHSFCRSCSKINDLSGERFGRWLVVDLDKDRGCGGNAHWICRCDCGTIRSINANNLTSGYTSSCGCYGTESRSGENCRFWNGGPITAVCEYCQSDYQISRSQEGATRFCSKLCMGKWQSKNATGENSFHWKGGPVQVSCDWCGKEYKRPKSKKTKNNFCCHRCYSEWLSENIVGEAHHNWDSGITEEERIIARNYLEIKQWSQNVLRRDNYTCQVCGGLRGNLEAHHLHSYKHHPDKRLDIRNGITLCRKHHIAFHKWMGGTKKKCTPQDFYNWLEFRKNSQ